MQSVGSHRDIGYEKQRFEARIINLLLLGSSFAGSLRFVFYKLIHNASIATYLWVTSMSILILAYCFKYFHHKTPQKIVITVAVYSLFLFSMYTVNSDTRRYYVSNLSYILDVTFIGMSGAVLIANVRDWHFQFKSLLPVLRIATILMAFIYLIGGRSFFNSMEWGQRITPVTLMNYGYLKFEKRNNRIDNILFVLSLVLSMLGGRQSLIIVLGSIAISEVYIAFEGNIKRKLASLSFITFTLWLFFSNYDKFINWLAIFLDEKGINSRALKMISQDRLFDTYNRDRVYYYDKIFIQEVGAKFSGLFTDRYFLSRYRVGIDFAHSFIYEILIDFGILFGTILLGYFAIKCVRAFLKFDKMKRLLFILMLGMCVGRYFVSGCIFLEARFWLFVGLICSIPEFAIKQENYKENKNCE